MAIIVVDRRGTLHVKVARAESTHETNDNLGQLGRGPGRERLDAMRWYSDRVVVGSVTSVPNDVSSN